MSRKFTEVKFEKLWRQKRGAVSQRTGQPAPAPTTASFTSPPGGSVWC